MINYQNSDCISILCINIIVNWYDLLIAMTINCRDTVIFLLKELDPDASAQRKTRRLTRRVYRNKVQL